MTSMRVCNSGHIGQSVLTTKFQQLSKIFGLALAVIGLSASIPSAYAVDYVAATGGTLTTYQVGATIYNVHTFTGNGTFTVTSTSGGTVNYLVIAGGGGGGSGTGGGGGAGGFLESTATVTGGSTAYTITVGTGGAGGTDNNGGLAGWGSTGNPSSFGSFATADGGGGGAPNSTTLSPANGNAGGSGGGGSWGTPGVASTGGAATPSGQGNAGGACLAWGGPYAAGGGGGAGAVGVAGNKQNPGAAGGAGKASSITGSSKTYAGGGGGGAYNTTGGTGGTGGGGNGGNGSGGATAGAANTGSGGGGQGGNKAGAGAGGSGIVIISYASGTSPNPTSTSATLVVLENTATALTASNFGYADPNSSPLTAVQITTLPALGTLKLSGTAVTLNQIVAVADINSGNLTYQSALPTYGTGAAYTTIGIKVENANSLWSAAALMTVNVTPAIIVQNPSFETPGASQAGNWASFANPPWSSAGSLYSQLKVGPGFDGTFNNAADGNWVALINNDDCPIATPVYQNLNTNVSAGATLSVTFAYGRALTGTPGQGVAYFDVNGTKYTMDFDASVLSAGQWGSVTMTKTITNSGNLTLGFYGNSAHAINVWVDKISDVSYTPGGSSYTVTFDNNTGSGTMSAQTGSSAAALTANTFTKTGYTFAGWNTAAGGGGTAYADGASYPFTASTTLYAQWTANTYTVTFDGNGGDTPSPTSKSVTYASTYGTLATVTRTGYTLNGWFTATSGGTQVTSGTTVAITGAQTLYAQWTAASATITLTDTLGAVNTTYGTPSASPTSFHVSGSDLTGDLTVTPPTGYEVSLSSGSGYTNSLSITASGTLSSTPVYVRLAATAGVVGSPYSGNITVSGGGASSQTIATASSTVAKADATVVVTPYTVTYDGNAHTATVTSITGVNGETGATVGTVTLNTTHTSAGVYATDLWTLTPTANYNNIGTTTSTITVINGNFETEYGSNTDKTINWVKFNVWDLDNTLIGSVSTTGAFTSNADPDGGSKFTRFTYNDAGAEQNLNTTVSAGDTLSVTFNLGVRLNPGGAWSTLDGSRVKGTAYFKVGSNTYSMPYDLTGQTVGVWHPFTFTTNITNSGALSLGFKNLNVLNNYYTSLDGVSNVSRTYGTAQTITNTINKADSSVTAPTVGTYTYTGSPQGPNSGAVATGSTGAVTYSYEGTSGTSYGPNATRPTNVGSYTVIATVAADSNYNTASSTATAFSIGKATPTATLEVSNTPTTYDGAAHAATVSITASSTTGSVANILTGGAATQTAAGTYAVTADFVPTDTANYNTLTEQSAGNFVIDNESPSSTGATLTALEDTQTALAAGNFGYSDPNSSAFTAVKITSLPALGTLKLSGASVTNNQIVAVADINSGNLTYQSALNGNGAAYTTFGIKVQNATAHWSAAAALTVNVTAVNDAPVATAQSVNVVINTAKAITLTGTDVEGSALTYTVVTQPTHGALTSTAPSVTYTPTNGYSGADSFTFKVNDGTIDSATAATVSLTVGAFSRLSTVSVPSSSMSTNFAAAVILPTSYATSPDRQYSVIYFLDGYNTGGRDGIRIFYDWYQSSLMSLSDKYDVIMVAVGCANKWYLDSPVDPAVRWQTFLTNELIPYVDSNYRSVATRQGRAITGLSMGGFGAFYTAFRNTDKFIAAGSTSGAVDFRPWPDGWEIAAVLGPEASNQSVWDATVVINNLSALPPAGGMGIIFDCATNDGFFSGVNAALDTQMTTSSIPHTYNTSTDGGGGHTMGYWGTTFPKHVAFFSQYLTNLTGGSFVIRINTVKTFAAADFRFADAGNALSAIKITSLPTHGTLTLSGTAITTVPSSVIAASSLGTLTYTPTAGYTGADAFDFQLRDTTTFSPDAVMVVSVTTDIPVLNGSFETPIVSGWSVVGSPWTSGAGGYGEYPSVPGFYDAVPTFAGSIAAVIGTGVTTSAPLVQNLGVSVAAGDTLSVTFWVGKAKDGVNSTGASYFEVAGTKYPTAFDTSDLSQGGWKSITMTQKISNSGNLSLGFYWTSGHNTSVDLISNVSVTPEPKGTFISFLSE